MTTQGGVLNLYKKRGETPLQRVERFRADNPEFKGVKMTYAGRLDPLAEGVLPVLYGGEVIYKDKYLNMDKEYSVQAFFGAETDTYDLLGFISEKRPSESIGVFPDNENDVNNIKSELKNFVGKRKQKYPPYSSKTVMGKSLFRWARDGEIESINMPEKAIMIYSAEFTGSEYVDVTSFKEMIFSSIDSVIGDFRQKETKDKWRAFFACLENRNLIVCSFDFRVSSGAYARGLIHDLGRKMGMGAIALKILRTKAGDYTINDSQR
ncbi:MAG: hypothetical protein A3G52_01330 [Candidatus Taylorbacteria bacterium RIFCSPLOWO2_12_FULL_43_20]|uniref:tRNA pseudouridine(55) synthase n=1 Tax=Candidatus Taylorbacteria bacterium RIFCSPLOWO2_12_FULL_43_20 TaxID=1802332 RepID=A0A1G2P3F9_9BACT|nr:MAG: hypothetical protein A2825_01255 [Candidatus Taylorbacteria bacterium RIFCSPHIGHO2_01_FULL_43_120]OHA22334.1 MAG: hypothetical protein A3B98_04450 [Candidatus Taylorbacteria bacterium RIFCSPHIGHO2_02_FULL_43_55]OHA30061.1 MAG: hypothetical protein A3E92_03410 [Candidatus Taylorbacteria bacterium RIFCSPHIGHO2_12_FULL_42_34]OHA32451.1 MAG: hypothetical protein A3B09_00015 [Candidatus Taylorbacteria bacterium RIFCSPLOWO2_01_FULL_43_83]OHA39542.1 MAG: hypothetical protein A3H58_02710 [Candi